MPHHIRPGPLAAIGGATTARPGAVAAPPGRRTAWAAWIVLAGLLPGGIALAEDQPQDHGTSAIPRLITDGPPTFALFGGQVTLQPVLRLDGDAGGFRGQALSFDGQPPRYLDDRPGIPPVGMNMRRARVGLQGDLPGDLSYSFQWNFAPGVGRQFEPAKHSTLFELQVSYGGLAWATPRVGAFTLMHTIEYAMSSFELTLMERPSIIYAATRLASGNSRLAVGGEAYGERWFAAAYASAGSAAVLNDSQQRGLVGRANAVLARGPWLTAVVGANAAVQLHPGTSPGPESVRLRDEPELRLDPTRLLDTGTVPATSAYALGPEVSGLLGPLYLQAEYQTIVLEGAGAPDRRFRGWYVTAALPLIGPPRRHDRKSGVFTRPDFEPLHPAAGRWGWLELAGRYSWISLNDREVQGNTQGVVAVGLNWYPARQLRLSLQYSNGAVRLPGPDRAFQAVAGRIALDW